LLSEVSLVGNDSIECLADEHKQAGICARPTSNPARAIGLQRVLLAADNRPEQPAVSDRRRYYVIFFHNRLPFYQIQSILLSDKFYGDAKPEWAVNLAGGERAGISVRVNNNYVEYGNLEADLPSLMYVRRRP
jgi:hypothetical protein